MNKMEDNNTNDEIGDNYSALINNGKTLSSLWRRDDKKKRKKKDKSKKYKRDTDYSSSSTDR